MVKLLFKGLIFLLLLFWAGFGVFWASLPSPKSSLENIDALAVFTGGAGRVTAGFQLMEQYDLPLLITGIYPQTNLADLTRGRRVMPDFSMLTLDHSAETTRQNMEVLVAWAQEHGYRRVGVVTADYHIPRVHMLKVILNVELALVGVPVRLPTPWLFYLREYVKLLNVLWLE